MLKNKLTVSLAAGGMALVGMIGGTALMASAQNVATNTSAVVTAAPVGINAEVDAPESANDVTDTTTADGEQADGANDSADAAESSDASDQ